MSPFVVLVVLVVGLLLLWGISALAARGSRKEEVFTNSSRTSPFITTLSMVTAAMTGVTFVSAPGSVAGSSLSYLQMCLGFIVGYAIVAWVLLPRFHALKLYSLYEYFEKRFGRRSHITGACFFFVSKMLINAIRFYLICAVLQFMVYEPLGIPFWVNVAIMGLLVWLSTQRGGVRSVIWMDVAKTILMFSCVVLCIFFAASMAGLSFTGAVEAICDHSFSKVWFVDDASDWRFLPKQFVAGVFMIVATTGLDQDFMQRALGGGRLQSTQRSMMTAVVLQTLIIGLLLLLGVLLYVYMERCGIAVEGGFPLRNSEGVAVVAKSDEVLAFVTTRAGLPLIVGVFFVIGLLFSSFSSIGSAMTAQATAVSVDILDGRNRGMNFMQRSRKIALPMVAVMTGVCVLAIDAMSNDNMLNMTYDIAAFSYGPLLGMVAFGIFSKRCVRDALLPYVVVLSPLLSFVVKSLALNLWGYQFGFELLVFNALLTMGGMWLIGIGVAKK